MQIVTSLTYGIYEFQVGINPANVAALMQGDVFYKSGDSAYQFLRSFYFDDIMPGTIRAFCLRFAEDSNYREASLARNTDWAQCNDLFLRNCFNPDFQANPFLENIGSLVGAYQFFKSNANVIITHPDYQTIYQYDSSIMPDSHQADAGIANIVFAFNQIEGVRTLASCQGVSGVVSYQNYEIMTLSPHARYAYIWFRDLSPSIKINLQQMPFSSTVYTENVYPTLQSTGDNPAFLAEICEWLRQSTT